MFMIRITGNAMPFQADAEDSLLSAALRAEQYIPYECNSGGCGACKFELISGEIEELWSDAPGLSDRDKRKGKYLACQCKAKSDLEVKLSNSGNSAELKRTYPPQRGQAKIIAKEQISTEMFRLTLRTDKPVEFIPGQYFMLKLPGLGSRAYSAASPVNGNELTFIIKTVPGGVVSNALSHNLDARLELDGPYGMSGLKTADEQQSVFIAGGSGLAPMVSMVNTLISTQYSRQITVFYGARLEEELVACDSLFPKAPNLKLVKVLSNSNENIGWNGETGYIHDVIPKYLSDYDKTEFYLCGPPPMITAVQKLLMLDNGVKFEHIHFDRFF